MKQTTEDLQALLSGSPSDRESLLYGQHSRPHAFLGPQRARLGRQDGTVLRVFHVDAQKVELLWGRRKPKALEDLGDGFFALWIPDPKGKTVDLSTYRLRFEFEDGSSWERDDPFRFSPTLGDLDLYYLSEGTHLRLWECLGARPMEHQGVEGFAFSVWAPNARRVSVVGDFCHWDGRQFPMQRLGTSGIFDLFLPSFPSGENYKFEILTAHGERLLKADPVARFAEVPSETASRTFRSSYSWQDQEWMDAIPTRDVTREAMSIYEVHLGSWLRGLDQDPTQPETEEPENDRVLTYRELAPRLVKHAKSLGFNYLELLPVAEHPYDGSWGYQITGYFAPTARHGDPDDFRFFVDHCHQNGIGVILDWVPAHFVKDAHGLGKFDGSALYEHADPRRGEHPDWGTYIFNYGRWEVRNFLVANALFWLDEFHVDGLRVDAVASMLYLDYSREEGQWLPNKHGGRENLEAIELLHAFNQAVHEQYPGHFTIAEESTAWPGITRTVQEGGLGFDLKWNMGWMHDTLGYFGVDPFFRSGCHDQLTFAMVYEHSERFVNPLSHDEVVHGKGSLYTRMPGDAWQKLANLRALLAYQFTRPGKKLLFMGSELASSREWNHQTQLDWYLLDDPARKGFSSFLAALGHLYLDHPCLWEGDPDPESFQWIACWDRAQSIFSYERRSGGEDVEVEEEPLPTEGELAAAEPPEFYSLRSYRHRLMVVLNLTPVPRENYRVGALEPGQWRLVLNSDETRFGGSGFPLAESISTQAVAQDNCRHSLLLTLPPLAALVFQPES